MFYAHLTLLAGAFVEQGAQQGQLVVAIVVVVVAEDARRQRGIVVGAGHFHIMIWAIFSVVQFDSDALCGAQRLISDLQKERETRKERKRVRERYS